MELKLIDQKSLSDGTQAYTYSYGSTIIALLYKGGKFSLGKITHIDAVANNSSVSISAEDLGLLQMAIKSK